MRIPIARRTFRLCLVVLGVIAPPSWRAPPVCAQDRVTINPYVGAHFADEDRFLLSGSGASESEVDDGPVVGLRVGIPFRGPWTAELTYGWTSFEVRHRVATIEEPEGVIARETYEVHFVEAGILWTALSDRLLSPVATLAAGIAHVDFEAEFGGQELPGLGQDDAEVAIVAGGGVVWRAAERVGIRVEVRDHVRFCSDICGEDATLHEMEISGGATISL
jgi:hypothetical protein